MTSYRQITFDAMHPGLSVRVLEDSNFMLVLDLLAVLTGNDRKKASQTLARVSSKPETSDLLTLRHITPTHGKKNPKKLISFSNAIQLLLVLPKRTVDLQTRRSVAGILADYFEAVQNKGAAIAEPILPPSPQVTMESLALRQTCLHIEQQVADLEHRRQQHPLEIIKQSMELLQQCGPLSEEEVQGFRRAITSYTNVT